jgi:hypothetical protein
MRDLWRYPTLLLWFVFFFVGLAPQPVFLLLREAGGVLPQYALVNSPYLITVIFAAYIALFSLHRCGESELPLHLAQDKALQLGVIALIAFLPVELEILITAHTYPLMQNRFLLYLAGAGKLVAWWYLFSLMLRYYVFRLDDVFARVPSVFPSARHDESQLPTGPAGQESRPNEYPPKPESN